MELHPAEASAFSLEGQPNGRGGPNLPELNRVELHRVALRLAGVAKFLRLRRLEALPPSGFLRCSLLAAIARRYALLSALLLELCCS